MDKKDYENEEDKTRYGEEIPSMFSWLTLSKQKERAHELENITKKSTNDFNKNNKDGRCKKDQEN